MGGFNSARVYRVNSFNEAEAKYNSIKPIRGSDNIRPLGTNRRHYMMASIEMPDADTVVLKNLSVPIVTWRRDEHSKGHLTVRAPGHYSAHNVGNITPFLPRGMSFEWIDCALFLRQHDINELHAMPKNTFKSFVHDPEVGVFRCEQEPDMFHIRRKRGVLEKAMRAYEPFFSWLTVVTATQYTVESSAYETSKAAFWYRIGLPSEDSMRHRFEHEIAGGDRDHNRIRFTQCMNAYSGMPYAFSWGRSINAPFVRPACVGLEKLARSDDPLDWIGFVTLTAKLTGRMLRTSGPFGYAWAISADNVRNLLVDIVSFLNRDEMFEMVRPKQGEAVRRTNQQYFREFDLKLFAE